MFIKTLKNEQGNKVRALKYKLINSDIQVKYYLRKEIWVKNQTIYIIRTEI